MRNTALLFLLLPFACSNGDRTPDKGPAKEPEKPAAQKAPRAEPDYVTVDHILIGVKMPRLPHVTRSAAEAKELAYSLLKQIEDDGDWAALKQEYSDDKQGGIAGGPYAMSNHGVAPRPPAMARGDMVPAFGNVGFQLEVGEVRIADYGPESPYGFHIIKRVK